MSEPQSILKWNLISKKYSIPKRDSILESNLMSKPNSMSKRSSILKSRIRYWKGICYQNRLQYWKGIRYRHQIWYRNRVRYQYQIRCRNWIRYRKGTIRIRFRIRYGVQTHNKFVRNEWPQQASVKNYMRTDLNCFIDLVRVWSFPKFSIPWYKKERKRTWSFLFCKETPLSCF